jgi:sulfite reductase alpha subunit-like flavoprotein
MALLEKLDGLARPGERRYVQDRLAEQAEACARG